MGRKQTRPIGFGSPPVEHQFKPGQSGNPRGRPKRARNLKSILSEEQSERVRVTDSQGRSRRYSKLQLVIKRLLEKAAKGDVRAISKLVELNIQLFGLDPDAARSATVDKRDAEIIEQYLERRVEEEIAKRGDGVDQ